MKRITGVLLTICMVLVCMAGMSVTAAAGGSINLEYADIKVDTANKTVTVYLGDDIVPESAYDLRFFWRYEIEGGESLTLFGTDFPNEPGTYIATITPNEGYTGEARSEEFNVRSAANGGGSSGNPQTGVSLGSVTALALAGLAATVSRKRK